MHPLPLLIKKTATTTRYWDCSGGACGCAYLPFAGDNARPAHCHSNAIFEAPEGNSHGAKFYGTAAISEALGGGNWLAPGCGKCWKVTGTSNAPGHIGTETTLVLKGVNFCPPGNTLCYNNPHFDIAAPGFDVTEYSFSNSCSEREEDEEEGFASCGRWMIDSQNPDENCDCSLFKSEVLRVGCDNFLSLWWDNSPVLYDEVECPTELSRLNCWEENDNGYPVGIPEFCANNDPDGTCGDGNVGDGVCPDGKCCSTSGYCVTTTGTCEPSPTDPPVPTTNAPTPTPDQKTATTTRYWDCSGGACGCAYLPFAGDNGRPAHCHSNAMFEAPEGNSHGAKFYGTAAISQALGGGNWLAPGCGKCWKVTGTSNAPGHTGIATTLVLKGVNFCPPGNIFCANNNPHFDIAAPGFDVTEFSLSNSCSEREADEAEGFASCGRWLIDTNNPDENCDW